MGGSPTSDTALSRPDLGLLAKAYYDMSPTMGFIGQRIFPVLGVPEASSTYPVLPASVMMSLQDIDRALRSDFPRSDYEFEQGQYITSGKGWEELIDDDERKLYSSRFDADVVAVERATGIVLRRHEKTVADRTFNTSRFTPTAVTNEWDDAANADPKGDVKTGKAAIREASGITDPSLIISLKVFENVRTCDQVVDQLKYTFPGIDISQLTMEQLARILDVKEVIVGGAGYNSANKGLAASISDIWSDEYAMLTSVATDVRDFGRPAIGRTFLWEDSTPDILTTEQYREESKMSDVFRVRQYIDVAYMQSFDDSMAIKSDISNAVSYLMSNITT